MKIRRCVLCGALLFGLTVQAPTAWAEGEVTTMFQDPPSSSEILEALGEKPKFKTRGVKTRAIEFLATPSKAAKSSPQQSVKSQAPHTVAFPLTFAVGSADLTENSKAFIDSMAEAIEQKPEMIMRISGHTDVTGSDETNATLSLRRAEVVKQYMVEKYNIDSARLTTSGEGSSHLLDTKNPQSGVNRRVEFVKEN